MIRAAVSWTLYPVLLGGSLCLTAWALQQGFGPARSVIAVLFLVAWPILAAQRWMPYERRWACTPREYALDLLHMLSTGLATEGWRALTLGGLLWLAGVLGGWWGGAMWPTEWPWAAQLVMAMVIGDLGAYVVHRSCHRFDVLWRVHAMHHSSERLYVFSSGRNHPMNAVLAYGSQLLPLTVLGAPVEVLALVSVFTGVNGMLQHANIELRHGLLNYVFSTVELHRWHHAARREDSDTNFGSNLILWDVIFGTRHLPHDREVREVGLPDVALPENYWQHLASPFTLQRWTTEEAAETGPTK